MTRAATKSLTIVSLLLALLLAGCGGGGELSQAEFKKKGNAACQKFLDASRKIKEPQAIGDIPDYAEQAKPHFDTLIEDLNELEPPKKFEADYKKLVDSAETARDRLSDVQKAAKAKDEPRLQELATEAGKADKASDELAGKVGLTACAQ
ncbi:MAG TPA: hypothetical protein VF533_16205 [Solirubrobacteraceae bacterium]|jgi:hypothetical protein